MSKQKRLGLVCGRRELTMAELAKNWEIMLRILSENPYAHLVSSGCPAQNAYFLQHITKAQERIRRQLNQVIGAMDERHVSLYRPQNIREAAEAVDDASEWVAEIMDRSPISVEMPTQYRPLWRRGGRHLEWLVFSGLEYEDAKIVVFGSNVTLNVQFTEVDEMAMFVRETLLRDADQYGIPGDRLVMKAAVEAA